MAYGRLYRERLLRDAFLALQPWRPTHPGRPGRSVDRRLRTRGLRATVQWVRHLRVLGAQHLAAVPDEILRQLGERILHIVERTPRYGDIVLAWFALKRLVGWNALSGRYSRVAVTLLTQWREEDLHGWWSGAAGQAMQHALFNRAVTTRNEPVRRALLSVVTTDGEAAFQITGRGPVPARPPARGR